MVLQKRLFGSRLKWKRLKNYNLFILKSIQKDDLMTIYYVFKGKPHGTIIFAYN